MEATIFTYIDSIVHSKKYVEDIRHEESQYNTYMCNRWLSMHSDVAAEIVNDSANKYWSQLTQKQDHYEFLLNLFPKLKWRKLSYIKKNKEESAAEPDESSARLAKRLEISKREVELYRQIS